MLVFLEIVIIISIFLLPFSVLFGTDNWLKTYNSRKDFKKLNVYRVHIFFFFRYLFKENKKTKNAL